MIFSFLYPPLQRFSFFIAGEIPESAAPKQRHALFQSRRNVVRFMGVGADGNQFAAQLPIAFYDVLRRQGLTAGILISGGIELQRLSPFHQGFENFLHQVDLVREKDKAQETADRKRQEILNFISKVEPGTGDTGRRHRRILKLYYCDALQWSDICAAIRPLRVRRDGRQVTYKKGSGVSETTIFRVRLEALAAAEVEFRRLGLG